MSENEITQERVRNAIDSFKNKNRVVHFPDNVDFITTNLKNIFGVEISINEVIEFWEWYSETYWFAGWLNPTIRDINEGFPRWVSYLESGNFEDLP
jgi:hypothetical protein